jgi:hypothetical protein
MIKFVSILLLNISMSMRLGSRSFLLKYAVYLIVALIWLVPLRTVVAIVNGTPVNAEGWGFVRWSSPSGTCSGTLLSNAAGQAIQNGDSGGSCFYALPSGQKVITGIQNGFWGGTFNQSSATLFRDWVHLHLRADQRGSTLATGDFDGDGYEDVAIAFPGGKAAGNRSGVVEIYRGWHGGLSQSHTLSQTKLGANETRDRFGASLAVGDFDGDGWQDLAVGAPGEAPGSDPRAGYVFMFNHGMDSVKPVWA